MKDIKVKNTKIQNALLETINSAPPCPYVDSTCKIKHNWEYKNDGDVINISGKIMKTLPEYLKDIKELNYTKTLRLAICLGLQLGILNDLNYGVLFFELSDILVIDENWYLLTNFSNAYPLTSNKKLEIIKPISDKDFIAPELNDISELPAQVNASCAYYSLALLCIKVYGFDTIVKDTPFELEIIRRTPLYFLLKRCLEKNPEERVFLLI